MNKQDLVESIPLAIVTVAGLYSIVEVATTEYIFGIPQYIGLTLLGISILLFSVNRQIYKYIFGLSLLLCLVNLIAFSSAIYTMTIFELPIQILILPVIAIFAWINKKEIKPKIKDLMGNSEEQLEAENNSKTNGFKRRFEKLSDAQIEAKLNSKMVPEAIDALKQIKEDRKNVL